MPVTPAGGAARVVLDTNVLLDLWLFDEPSLRPLRAAIEARQLQALRSVACEAELAEVLARSQFGLDQAGCTRLLERWRACSAAIDPVQPATLACTDPDDQKFLDAAFSVGADGLITRDKALLQLARRAAAMGLAICTPAEALPRYGLRSA